MLDHSLHQAAGLLDLGITLAPQLVAMVNHGDDAVELPLLLQMCTALTRLGHSVTVLDGTTLESADNPGLAQLCNGSLMPDTESEEVNCSILPARQGLQRLCDGGPAAAAEALSGMGRLFPPRQIVILYSTTPTLTDLLHGSDVRPVLPISAVGTSLLTSYLALKRLLLKGPLEPTIVNVMDNAHASENLRPQSAPTSLSDCARYFLNYDVNALNIKLSGNEELPSADVERMVLGLLENALPLQTNWPQSPRPFATPLRNHHSARLY